MKKVFYCTLPNYKWSFDTERGLYYHENRIGPIHNRNKCYEVEPPSSSYSTLPHSNKRRNYDIPISYEVSLISENENYKKPRRGIRYIDADILKGMMMIMIIMRTNNLTLKEKILITIGRIRILRMMTKKRTFLKL